MYKKKRYLAPTVAIEIIELEHSIAASSTTVSPVSPGNNGDDPYPFITDESINKNDQYWDID